MDLFFLEELMKVDTAAGVVPKDEGEEEDDEEEEQADACSEDLGDAPAPPTPTQDQGPLAKRPRRGSLAVVAAGISPVKAAAAEAIDGDGCLGCGRLRSGRCFRDPAAKLTWG